MKRIFEGSTEEIQSNKKNKHDHIQQRFATNETSFSNDGNKFDVKTSSSETDENIIKSSEDEDIEYNTVLNSSHTSETEEEGNAKIIDL